MCGSDRCMCACMKVNVHLRESQEFILSIVDKTFIGSGITLERKHF